MKRIVALLSMIAVLMFFLSFSPREAEKPIVKENIVYLVEAQTETENIVSASETKALAVKPQSILLNNDILAFYGHPVSKNMGILGRHSKEELVQKLETLAEEYRLESGGRNIQKAFYIIYGTVQPEGNILTIDRINKNLLTEWIEFAAENDMLVFIDHQIGKYDPVDSLATMFPYLSYPNVHLAIDPEWRTSKPMKEFGYVTGDEINKAQETMEDYIIKNNIEGERMLVIHQFRDVMIKNRAAIRSDFERVRLVHCMDGVGTPAEKLDTYKFNALAKNMPIKAFKLFYDFKIPGVLVDTPLLKPKDVYALEPRPYIIMYQ
ncbi:hypothetical protein AGMMS50212_13550 [Spirochaetia bacterium]|nr:hypothetical protein AGMMS50212_13550 [Spirochaetia bacterium]